MSVPSPHDAEFMLVTALVGFAAARDRFLAAAGVRDASAAEVFVPLTEALWWTVSVDDGFEAKAANLGAFRQARDTDPDGKVLRGLRWVRDRCGHQRALAADYGGGRSYPRAYPFSYLPWTFRWRPVAELPRPHPKFDNPTLEAEYVRHLVGKPAADTVKAASAWFDAERQRQSF
ncbi:hypothetical protein [Actinomadura sp. NEAU-AAG7]|uniref:hypothetical protein n=1 Tax=Actinomadura sp. NEAU-AAG7 TaxID=2839640 RepID=UPI001BE4990D|nr:hypothetical protein [Actinomadura sp. NEAU-AAG7]MBT2207029.1 hypothetical protein [Actinomadura sp. NEAU-AAG7]